MNERKYSWHLTMHSDRSLGSIKAIFDPISFGNPPDYEKYLFTKEEIDKFEEVLKELNILVDKNIGRFEMPDNLIKVRNEIIEKCLK